MQNYTPMMQQYLSIKAEYKDAFLFFRLGDFYEMFFEDAEAASRILEITLTGRDAGQEERIPMCGVPYHSAEAYISKLVENGYKVAICEQVEDPKEAKGVVRREVVRVITPGTVMEGKIIEEKSNNYIASIAQISENIFGIAFSDISTGEFYATEIIGDFEKVITEIYQYTPAEILINQALFVKTEKELQSIRTTITIYEQQIEKPIEQDFSMMLNGQFGEMTVSQASASIIKSSGQLLAYLIKTQQKKLIHFNRLEIYDSKSYLILDAFSKKNLELTQTNREQSKKGSLLWLLDKTATAMGSRLLRRWIEKPLLSQNLIEERLDNVEALINSPILMDELNNELKNIYDIERIVSKVSYGNANPRDLYNLQKSLERVYSIYQLIEDSRINPLINLVKGVDLCDDIVLTIKNAINAEPPLSAKDGGIIKRGYNEQLDAYYLANTEGKDWLQELERREKELTGIKSLKVGYNKVFGYFIEVTKSNLNQVPKDRYIRKQTLSNAERYITEELKDKESIILEAEEKMLELEYSLFTALREKIALEANRLQKVANLVAKIDVLISFANISNRYKYIRPQLNTDGKIQIKEGRHPVVEAINNDNPFIPNDVFLDNNTDQILIITGPNMAGKSTYMRQIALITIMAQIGCFVPASNASISIIDRIFTRIGAGDDLTSGQSTFMVEMLETKHALTQATPNSLILLDEIGRGTSTYDGMALAQAIIQYIHDNVKAKTLFSTHYHELTGIADIYSRIKNIHVNVIEKDGRVIFLHKIEVGKADKSYGIHVAELAGMPQEVIDNAKIILEELESKANDMDSLNKQQLSFFQQDFKQPTDDLEHKSLKQIAKKIENLDLINMTPMEGFQILYDIQRQLRK